MAISSSHCASSLQTLKLECSSEYDIEEFDFEWKLNNLSSYLKISQDVVLESSVFKGGLRGEHSWKLKCWRDRSKDSINYSFSLDLVAIGNACGVKTNVYYRKQELFAKLFYSYTKSSFEKERKEISLDVMSPGDSTVGCRKYIPNESIGDIVFCKIFVFSGYKHSGIHRSVSSSHSITTDSNSTNIKPVVEAMKTLLHSKEFSDIIIVASSKRIHAHKTILAARSPVLAAMFRTNMREARTNLIQIDDFGAASVEAMLEHIYTGEVTKFQENAFELFQLAEKYELKQLKSECEFFLCSHLSVENAVAILQLATVHNSREVKAASLRFIHQNKVKIGQTSVFKDIAEKDPSLMLDLYLSI